MELREKGAEKQVRAERNGGGGSVGGREASLMGNSEQNDPFTYAIIGCAIAVHRRLGPGLLEAVYQECLEVELLGAGFRVKRHPQVGLRYDGLKLDHDFRPDFIVDGRAVLEVKSVAALLPVHGAQLLTYMKLAQIPCGLLINFNVPVLRTGVRRLIWTEPPAGGSV